jgi:hypothetical protein
MRDGPHRIIETVNAASAVLAQGAIGGFFTQIYTPFAQPPFARYGPAAEFIS